MLFVYLPYQIQIKFYLILRIDRERKNTFIGTKWYWKRQIVITVNNMTVAYCYSYELASFEALKQRIVFIHSVKTVMH